MHVVLQTDAEFSANVNARFIAKSHLRLEFRGVAADQIRPLVAVHAHAVSQAMREIFVVRAVARVGDDLTRGGVDGAGFYSRLRGCQRGALGSMYDVENLFHFVAGFAEYKGARDIGRVAFHRAATVDQHYRAFPN